MKTLTFSCQACLAVLVATLVATSAQAALLGVTGTGGGAAPFVAESLYVVDTTDASSSFYMTLGNGGDGEAIAYNPDDGLLYHGSGNDGTKIFESVNLLTQTTTDIPITGPTALNEEFVGLVYNSGGSFFATLRGGNFLRTINTAGAEVNLGGGFDTSHGLAILSTGELLSANINNMNLTELNTADGSVTSTIAVSSTIVGASGFTGLALNPDDDTLWGIVRIGSDRDRRLVRIDNIDLGASTATATEIGDLGERFAGLAFVPDASLIPEPSSVILAGLGLIGGLGLMRRRRS